MTRPRPRRVHPVRPFERELQLASLRLHARPDAPEPVRAREALWQALVRRGLKPSPEHFVLPAPLLELEDLLRTGRDWRLHSWLTGEAASCEAPPDDPSA